MNPNFYNPTKIILGGNCVTKHGAAMADVGKKALIVTGKSSALTCGALTDIIFALAKNKQKYEIFNRVISNPTVDCVYEGARIAREFGADFIIGIGGGSPMDAAKAIAMLAAADIPRESLFSGENKERALPCVMVPTTAGTGSEITPYSVLTNDELKTKTSISGSFLLPVLAYLDGRYLKSLPANVIVNTAVDALSHLIEGYLSHRANPITDAVAREAMHIIAGKFEKLIALSPAAPLSDRDFDDLLYASAMAGIVIAHTGTVAPHAMGYPLTYFKNIDHGRATGLILGIFLSIAAKKAPVRTAEIYASMSCKDSSEFVRIIDSLLGEKEKIMEEDLRLYTEKSVGAKNLSNCIFEMTKEEIEEVYRRSFGL